MRVARDAVKQGAILLCRPVQPQLLQKGRPTQILSEKVAGHGDQQPSARPGDAADLVQDSLHVGDVFQHGVADDSVEGMVSKRHLIARALQRCLVRLTALRLLQRAPPRVQPHIQRLGKRHLGKMPIAAAHIQHRPFKLELLVETGFDGAQQGAKCRHALQMPPQ